MDETQDLALLALRELLDDPERNDWDDLLAANRALIRAIEAGEPMTRRNARIVAEYLREAGWRERAIDAATAQTDAYAGTGYAIIPSRVETICGDGGTVGEAIPPTARGYVVSTAARRDPCGWSLGLCPASSWQRQADHDATWEGSPVGSLGRRSSRGTTFL
jgi:hypothetical protein